MSYQRRQYYQCHIKRQPPERPSRPAHRNTRSFDRFLRIFESRVIRIGATLGIFLWISSVLAHEAISQYETIRIQVVHAKPASDR